MPAYVDTGLNIVHVDDVAEGQCSRSSAAGSASATSSAVRTARSPRSWRRSPGWSGAGRPACGCRRRPCGRSPFSAEAIARWRGAGEPLLTTDGLRLARKKMYFSSAKAERELGYHSRPGQSGVARALDWYRDQGRLR